MSNQQTPNADDVFGAQSSVPDADSVFGKDSSQEPSYSGSFADHMFGQGTLHKVGQAFMSDLSSGVQQANDTSKAIDDSLRKIGVYGQPNQKSTSMVDTVKQTLQTYNEAFLRPTINGIVSTAIIDTSALGSGLQAAGGLAQGFAQQGEKDQQKLDKLGIPSALSLPSKAINTLIGGYGDIAQATGAGEYIPEIGGVPHEGAPVQEATPHIEPHFTSPVTDTYTARAHGVVGEGEEGYFNTKPLSPENQAARDEYAREVGIDTPKPGPVVKNPDELVPQIAPDLVKEYDEKLAYHDELAARLEELQPKESVGEEGVLSVVADKSPEYLAAQEAFKDNYLRLKELEPQINEVRAHAEELVGDNEEIEPGKTAEQPTTASEKPVQTGQEGTPNQSTKETEAPQQPVKSTHIADTVKQQLVNAGRPEEEAQAAGQLVQARYESRSSAFQGARGSAEDLFHQDFPKIIKGEDTGTPKGEGKVLNQAVHQDRLRVARKMPDGSVRIGKPGDLHMDLIGEDETDRSSVGYVGLQEFDMGFAAPDGKFLSRSEAMDWVKEHQPEVNPDIANGGSRNKDKLESIGYEKELKKNELKENASSKLPPHLEDEEPGFRISPASIADEHAREVSSLESEGWKKFEEENKKPEPYRAGQPIKAFHGTSEDFNEFDTGKQGKNNAPDAKLATFFTDDPDVASSYAHFDSIRAKENHSSGVPDVESRGVGANVRPVYLHMKKPKVVDYEGRTYSATAFKRYLHTAKEEGHDGVVFKNVNDGVLESSGKNSTVYALFNPKDQVTTRFGNVPDKTYNQSVVKPTFYSSLERGVDKAGPNSGSADQWSKTIDNLTGVKKEEVEWSGVKDWLKDQKGPVSKDDIKTFLKENNVKIKEVEKGQPDTYETYEPPSSATRYPTVKLPGGQNYRELLLTLPNKTVRLSKDEYKEYSNLDNTEDRTPDQEKRYEELIAKDLDNLHKEEQQPTFQSSHWSEPNVLSHVRFDTRTGPNGEKILHVAEVQSDWHQKGRKEGYSKDSQDLDKLRNKIEALRVKMNEMLDRHGIMDFDTRPEARNAIFKDPDNWEYDTPEDKALAHEYSNVRGQYENKLTNKGIPDAPFKQTWQELSMKRMIRYAAENGFDKLSWDTGETNAKRARQLLTNVKEIQWNPETKQFHLILDIDNTRTPPGTLGHRTPTRSLGLVDDNKLEGYIGKDGAQELLNSPKDSSGFHTLAKDNLTVGGQGNREFYDKILPGFMNKYVKKWGSFVKDDTVSTGDSDFHSAVAASDPDSDIWHLQNKETGERLQNSPLFENRLEAEQWLSKNKPPQSSPAHSVNITPQMKDSVLNEGQPLFQNQKRGSLTIKEGRNVIRLFKDADASTFIHEVGHQWLEELQSDAEHPDAPDDIKRDTQVVRDWLGAEEGSPLSVAQHEKFARGFERYMREGNAPSAGLRGVFERFKTWLTQIYRTATQLRAPISDDIRQVFDRLLSSPEEGSESGRVATASEETSSGRQGQASSRSGTSSGTTVPKVQGTGEKRISGLAQQLEDNARSSGLADTLGKLPDYKSLVMKDVWEKAAELVTDDPDRAKEVAMGNADPPDGTTPVAVFKALSKDAMDRGDLQTVRDLAKSETPKTITKIAQALRSAATEDDLNDPVSAIQAVQDAREKAMTKRLRGKNLDVERDKMAEEIRSNMQELQPSDFESFIRSIECDY